MWLALISYRVWALVEGLLCAACGGAAADDRPSLGGLHSLAVFGSDLAHLLDEVY